MPFSLIIHTSPSNTKSPGICKSSFASTLKHLNSRPSREKNLMFCLTLIVIHLTPSNLRDSYQSQSSKYLSSLFMLGLFASATEKVGIKSTNTFDMIFSPHPIFKSLSMIEYNSPFISGAWLSIK